MSFVSHIELVDMLVCPICKEQLELKQSRMSKKVIVKEGLLICNRCNQNYPIKKGIVVLVKTEENL